MKYWVDQGKRFNLLYSAAAILTSILGVMITFRGITIQNVVATDISVIVFINGVIIVCIGVIGTIRCVDKDYSRKVEIKGDKK